LYVVRAQELLNIDSHGFAHREVASGLMEHLQESHPIPDMSAM
jgi:hypothetical protein